MMQLEGNVPALFAALAAAKASDLWKAPSRNREVTVYPRKRQDGSQPAPYKFKYATLDELIDCTEKALAAQGLSMLMIDYEADGHYYLRTMLVHAEGGSLSFQRELARSLSNQERGSELTYSQRYSYKLVLCLAADDDDDANAADGNEVTSKSDRQRAPEPPAPRKPQDAPRAQTAPKPAAPPKASPAPAQASAEPNGKPVEPTKPPSERPPPPKSEPRMSHPDEDAARLRRLLIHVVKKESGRAPNRGDATRIFSPLIDGRPIFGQDEHGQAKELMTAEDQRTILSKLKEQLGEETYNTVLGQDA